MESDYLAIVGGLANRLSTQRSIRGACEDVLDVGLGLTSARCAEVLFRETETRQLVCLANQGPYPWCAAQAGGRRLGSRLVEATLQDHLPFYVDDVGGSESLDFELADGSELRKALSVPLVVRGRALGAINLCGTEQTKADPEVVTTLSLVAGLLAPIIENLYVTARTTSKEIERRQFLIRELEATEDERQRIARELHDGLGQSLTGLVMHIDGAIALLSQPNKEAAAVEGLKRSRDVAAAALQDIRRVMLALRPTILDDMGLFAALEAYARRVLDEAGIQLRVRISGEPDNLPPAVENVIFRVMQEALNNVARHSKAGHCSMILIANRTTLSAAVEDDGIGFDPEAEADDPTHFGLKNMKERVEIIGGSSKVISRPGSGSRVEVRVAYRGKHGPEDADSHS